LAIQQLFDVFRGEYTGAAARKWCLTHVFRLLALNLVSRHERDSYPR